MIKIDRTHLAAAAGVLLAAGSGLFLYEFSQGRGLRNASYDLLQVAQGDRLVNEAVLVYLDEISHQKLNQNLNAPWDRALHAKLIQRLTAAGARGVVFDIVFDAPSATGPQADDLLAQAIKDNGHIVLAADNVPTGPKRNESVIPIDLLLTNAANMGSTELHPDADFVVRRHTLEDQLPPLAWAAAEVVGANAVKQDKLRNQQRWMNYYGRPNRLPSRSYYEALDPSAVPDSFFRDKVVFVGARIMTRFAGERKDEYRSPFSSWVPSSEASQSLFMPGVEFQATAFLNLLRSDWLSRFSPDIERLFILGLGALFGFGLIRFHPVVATGISIAGISLAAGGSYLLFRKELIWFPWLLIVTEIVIALCWSILFNSIQLYVQKRLYEQTLRLYLPPKLVKKFAKSRELLKPGAVKQTLTLLFSDIANFTSTSEGMDSDELAVMMNTYFQGAIKDCIHKADGTVAKMIGDAIFAFWNAPDDQEDHALRACQAALLFREHSKKPVAGRNLHTRIGLHTGVANVGNFGSEDRVDYTALGENVNLASRLEGLNKHLGTVCLMSGATHALLGDRLVTRPLGQFQLKGFEGLVEVHELVGLPEEAEPTKPWREAFAEAMMNYEQRNLEFAEMGFRRVLELKPEDGPSKFFIDRIAELGTQELPENWATHTILKEK